MNLIDQINNKRKDIKTDAYSMSIGEWISMYENKELDIHPEFQRFYRWSSLQKSKLIESILLGIPLPSVFVSQRADGVWDVIDGLQRLSTIFQFAGILKDESNNTCEPLILEGTTYLSELKDTQWLDEDNPAKSLSKELQLVIKRSKISVSIVLKESDDRAKYDLFQRLNTGGSELSPQEVRNCLLLMMNKDFFEWLKELPKNENFKAVTALSENPIAESYDVELALRFVLLAIIDESDIKSIGDVGAFLTEKMTQAAENKSFDFKKIEDLFLDTFTLLNRCLSDDAFKRYNNNKNRHEGGFLLSLFEVIALGIAYNISNGTLCEESLIPNKVSSISNIEEFKNWSSSGVNASRRLPKLIPLGRTLFKKQ